MYGEISELINIGRELHLRGWLPATGGNLSARLKEELICITASGSHKGHLTMEDFVFVDLRGNVLEGRGKPSAETELHLLVYRLFPEVRSVLHVHSLNSTLISRLSGDKVVLEGYELLKAFNGIRTHQTTLEVPVLENSQDMRELSKKVEEALREGPGTYGFLLRSHGLYTWGGSIREAYIRLEAFDFLFECELKLLLGGKR